MNDIVEKFLKTHYITKEEYNILFCDKNDFSENIQKQIFFNNTLQKIIDLQKEQHVNLSYIRFYQFKFDKYKFDKNIKIIFRNSIFIAKTDFKNLIFNQDIDFERATFSDNTSFRNTKFHGHVYFRKAIFSSKVTFINVTFCKKIYFTNVIFHDKAYFRDSKFIDTATYNDAQFDMLAEFRNVIFEHDAYFHNVTFKGKVIFQNAKLFGKGIFREVSFLERVSFENINAYKMLDFAYSQTKDIIDFSDAKFYRINLEHSRFSTIGFLNVAGFDRNKKVVPLKFENFINKESARLLKTLFEKENNITEANKYFAIEQDLYIQYLKKSKVDSKRFSTLISLYLNKFVSHHGTNWINVLGLIFIFSLIVLIFYDGFPLDKESVLNIPNRTIELINPLNVFKKDYNLYRGHEFWAMIVRVITIYLFYQFAVAFRQNTRRK